MAGPRNKAVMGLSLLVLLTACGKERPTEPLSPRVYVQQVSTREFAPPIQLSGDIQARVETQLSFRVGGKIIERKVDVGQTVAAAFQAPELFVIAGDLTNMQVRADVSEADIGRVDEGQKVNFTVDAYPDREFSGKVIQVRAAPATKNESSSGTASNVVVYGVLVSAPNQDLLLKPGMTAT
ncbi:MAG: efflux RND transporter periplasmic adaptor subunit, partial [Pseudomonadales bacterium]|nr:efflux RND transporter periplasmic adaptor subunit [Pseudomonadales bacterium]